ncbi:MAG: hypothetical protein ACR2K5_11740 [Pseudolabrys sp.]
MAKAKKRTAKVKVAKRAPARKKTVQKAMVTEDKNRARRTADQGFWANFFGAFAGPSSGR